MFWLVCLVPTLPLAITHWLGLLGDWRYAFLPLPFLLIAFLYWQRSEGTITRPQSAGGWAVVVIGLIAVLLGGLIAFPWFGALAFVLVVAGAMRSVRGTNQRTLVGLIAPLLAISLPSGVGEILASVLNRSTAWLSSIFLDYFEMPHSVSGSVIRLFESEVLASRVCDGFVSFPFLLFVAFSLLAWKRMSLWLLPFYTLAAVITALGVNSLRLVISVIAAESMEMDLSEGWYPMAMSFTAVLIGFGMLYSFHHLLAIAFHYVEPNTDAGSNPFVQFWNKFSWMNENRATEEFARSSNRDNKDRTAPGLASPVWLGLIGTAAVLSLLALVGAFRGGDEDFQITASTGPLFAPTETLFAKVESNDAIQIEKYETTADDVSTDNPESKTGQRSDTWTGTFRNGNLTLQITQPVSGWLELTRAYKQRGWEIIDRDNDSMELAVASEKNDPSKPNDDAMEKEEEFNAFATARMRSTDGSDVEGYLYYSAVGSDGRILETPTSLSSMWQSLRRRLGMRASFDTQAAAVIQLLVITPEKLSPGDIRSLKREFVKRREAVAQAITGEEFASSDSVLKDSNTYTSSREPQS